jgi:hypothetical protein
MVATGMTEQNVRTIMIDTTLLRSGVFGIDTVKRIVIVHSSRPIKIIQISLAVVMREFVKCPWA